MALIRGIGPLEIFLLSGFAALFLYRVQAAAESRIATALVFVCSARFGASFINGFSISEATKLSLGQLDTVFAYLMLAFAFLEILLLKRITKWRVADLWVLVGLLGLGILNLAWKLAFNAGLSANDLLYVLPVFFVFLLRPTKKDVRFLPYFGAVLILLVSMTALVRYQNPLFPYSQLDYGLGGPYQNRIWSFFGLEERFRGPYYHPNQLGIQITFLSTLVLLRSTKFYLAVLPFSFTLLFLASSRTSILALTIGLLVRVYFDRTRPVVIPSLPKNQGSLNNQLTARFTLRKIVFGFAGAIGVALAARQIIGTNTTGSGRLENYRNTLSGIQNNLLLGQGPSIFSINITENSVLTILSYYGLLGLILLVAIVNGFRLIYKETSDSDRKTFQIALATFLVATLGEALLTGTSQDTGVYYLIILLALTRREPSSTN